MQHRYEKIILRTSRNGSYAEIIDALITSYDEVLIARKKISDPNREILDFDLPVTDLPLTSNLINRTFGKYVRTDTLSRYELCVPANIFMLLINNAERMLRISSMNTNEEDISFKPLREKIEKDKRNLEYFDNFPIVKYFCKTCKIYISKIKIAGDTITYKPSFKGKMWYEYLANDKKNIIENFNNLSMEEQIRLLEQVKVSGRKIDEAINQLKTCLKIPIIINNEAVKNIAEVKDIKVQSSAKEEES